MRTAIAKFVLPHDASKEQIAYAEQQAVQELRRIGAYGEVWREGVENRPEGLHFTYTAKER
ncbi:hypothetical protein SEA_PANAMAXUS_41 [Mycobacterium phage Panamaxus]|uniref:Uncharacterized protein n=1 Tax=Mycobacterium phage Veracruz TaxID=2530154 RepID=A0A481VTG0_9CAUD|nr:hypothetical protein KIP27_gp50 [Mycobacterium phage Veracruz]AIS73716.1 hypothetical protein PBI_QUINNKIRO_42 [Mycobacterium phage QuinnKiro]ALA11845.1 hypothetical protein SEA_TEXAGE_42 [Mycobacterium phage Texage]AOT24192.1 hypothetical protein SEA_TODACORO_43 [Mycobacterium phage Todacoro]AOT25545.1 hypothetical protein SEA_MARGO_43 [Mycobacterium phage Margo]AUX82339.1 hypothetical protein SEA_LAMBERT1_43 [Mycobacterium phage Lambert1]AVP42960.1 hypothetical protein SEA_PANAMAXUS_41 [